MEMEEQVLEEEILQEWVTPAFECVPLNEALLNAAGLFDGTGFSS